MPPPYLLLVIATVIWGGNFVVGRAIHDDIGPLSLNFWRWAVSGVLLAPFAITALKNDFDLIKKHFRLIVLLALTGMVLFHSLIYAALHTTNAINASLVLATMPLVIPVVSYFAGEDTLRFRQAIGIAVSFVGVGAIISRGDIGTLLEMDFAPGDLLVLAAVVMWSLYSVMLKRLPKNIPPVSILGIINWMAIIMLLPAYVWEFSTQGGFAVSTSNLVSIAYVAVFASIVAFISWNRAVQVVGPNRAGLFIHVIPLSSAIFAIVFLGERLEMYHLAGAVPIAAGIFLTTRMPNMKTNNQTTATKKAIK